MKTWPSIRPRTNPSGSQVWIVEINLPGKKRERLTFSTKSEANNFAELKRQERKQMGLSAFDLTENEKRAAFGEYKKVKEAGFHLQDVVKTYLDNHKIHSQSKTVSEVVKEILDKNTTLGFKKLTMEVKTAVLNKFCRNFGDKLISEIQPKEIELWLNSDTTWTNQTKINYHRYLTAVWNYAKKHGYCIDNPLHKIEKPVLEDKPVEILTVEQARLLIQLVSRDPKLLAFVVVGLFAGLRISELDKLTWEEIDLGTGLIEVTAAKSKTRARRHVTISENLRNHLAFIPVLPSGPITYPKVQRNYKLKSFLKGKLKLPKNCMRHSYASYFLALHKDAAKTSHELGHSDPSMLFAHYRALVSEAQAKEYWNL